MLVVLEGIHHFFATSRLQCLSALAQATRTVVPKGSGAKFSTRLIRCSFAFCRGRVGCRAQGVLKGPALAALILESLVNAAETAAAGGVVLK